MVVAWTNRLDPDLPGTKQTVRVADPPMTGQHATRRSLSLSLGLSISRQVAGASFALLSWQPPFFIAHERLLAVSRWGTVLIASFSGWGCFLRSRYLRDQAASFGLQAVVGNGILYCRGRRPLFFWGRLAVGAAALGGIGARCAAGRSVEGQSIFQPWCAAIAVRFRGRLYCGRPPRSRSPWQDGTPWVDRVRRCQPARRHARILRTFARNRGPRTLIQPFSSAGCACWVVRSFCTRCTWRLARLPGKLHMMDGGVCVVMLVLLIAGQVKDLRRPSRAMVLGALAIGSRFRHPGQRGSEVSTALLVLVSIAPGVTGFRESPGIRKKLDRRAAGGSDLGLRNS